MSEFRKIFQSPEEVLDLDGDYEEIWDKVKDYIEGYMQSIAKLFEVEYEEDEISDDAWGYWLKVDELYLEIRLIDSIYYEGENMGFNVEIKITDIHGNERFAYIPYNYTPAVWTFDVEELKERLDIAPWREIITILALQREVSC